MFYNQSWKKIIYAYSWLVIFYYVPMEFFLSTAVFRYELWLFALSAAYIIFHFWYSITQFFVRLKKILTPSKIVKEALREESVISEEQKEENDYETSPEEVRSEAAKVETTKVMEEIPDEVQVLTKEDKEEISDLIKLIKIKLSRGEFSEARARIVEGLSIEKFNKDLNCLLAGMYESEKDYKKAELIYKDIIVFHETDLELYMKLGFVLSVQKKYEVAFEIYKKGLSFDENNIESIEMLANLGFELERFEESVVYAKMFLKKYPRNYDMLHLLAMSYIKLTLREEALESLKKLKTLDPYNGKIQELIDKTLLEIEMEKNFNAEEK